LGEIPVRPVAFDAVGGGMPNVFPAVDIFLLFCTKIQSAKKKIKNKAIVLILFIAFYHKRNTIIKDTCAASTLLKLTNEELKNELAPPHKVTWYSVNN
jgi:hypothetical protein